MTNKNETSKQCVVIIGDPSEPQDCHGPFNGLGDAIDWTRSQGIDDAIVSVYNIAAPVKTKPEATDLTPLEKFLFDNAACSFNPETETEERGRMRGARELAKAVRYAAEQCWRYRWEQDDDGCSCQDEDAKFHTVEYCILSDIDGKLLGSLSGICGATEAYRRTVEAELALEAMTEAATRRSDLARYLECLKEAQGKEDADTQEEHDALAGLIAKAHARLEAK